MERRLVNRSLAKLSLGRKNMKIDPILIRFFIKKGV